MNVNTLEEGLIPMRLALVFDKLRDDTVGVYFEQACQELGIPYKHFWTREAEKIPSGYDLYLRVDHGDYQGDLPSRLRPQAFYAVDSHLTKSWRMIRKQAQHYDLVFCAQQEAAARLPRAHWVPLGCDPHLHRPLDLSKRWDVAFVGTEGGVPRKFYLQALKERYPNSFIGHAPHTRMGEIYSSARIGFHFISCQSINQSFVSMRVFEVMACGTCLVTNALEDDSFRQLGMIDRQHLVTYRNPRELFETIDYYLAYPEERERIATQGQRLAIERHAYTHRLQQMLDLLAQHVGRPFSMGQREEMAVVTRESL